MLAGKTLALVLSGALILAGVLIEGSDRNPWNLVLPYLFAVSVLEAWRANPNSWLRFLQTTVVCGVSVYGAVWTLGPGHAAASWSSLVYVGLSGAVFASVSPPTSTAKPGRRDG
jgi:hypothetical protein